MKLRAGDLVLIRMRFHAATGSKVRPAVVMFDSGDEDFIAAPVTSQNPRSSLDVTIESWQGAGLNVASYIRVDKLSVLPKADVLRSLGSLSSEDSEALATVACRIFCPSPAKS